MPYRHSANSFNTYINKQGDYHDTFEALFTLFFHTSDMHVVILYQ